MESIEESLFLPVVNLASASAAREIYEACKDYGFFILTNHGVSTVSSVLEHSRAFFQLPDDIKSSCSASLNGYTHPFSEILDPDNQTIAESKEGYYIRREPKDEEKGDPTVRNVWPSDALLPGWKEAMLEYYDSMMMLGIQVSRLLAEGLGLEREFFAQHFSQSMSAIRLLHYKAEVSNVAEGVLGAGAHSDYGLLTFLSTDDVPGLQVFLNGKWLNIPPTPGDFVVNLGDMLMQWTNDHFRSTLHRVVNFEGRERYSIPFFFETNFDTRVECLAQFVSDAHPAKYPPTTSGKHLLDKYRKTQGVVKK